MDNPPENFENLRRLLALKRHEQPPPGYFDEFRAEILDRLRAGDMRRETTTERISWEVPWLHRFLELLSAKPALTGVFGAAACAAVLSGVLYAERLNMPALAQEDVASPVMLSSTAPGMPNFPGPLAHDSLVQPQLDSSTNAIPPGLFGQSVPAMQVGDRPRFPFGGN